MRKHSYLLAFLFAMAIPTSEAQTPPPRPRNTGAVFSNPGSVTTCFNHVARCIIPVYVHTEGDSGCSAWIDPAMILVQPPDTTKVARIKVIWALRKGDKDTKLKQYFFDFKNGISANTGAPTDQFTSEGHDGPDGDADPDDTTATKTQRFRWASKNPAQGAVVAYTPFVYRNIGTASAPLIVRCDASDPTISNNN